MGSFSIWHWLVVLLVILLLFGSGKISGLMGDLAKGIKSFKQNIKEDEKDASMAAESAPLRVRLLLPTTLRFPVTFRAMGLFFATSTSVSVELFSVKLPATFMLPLAYSVESVSALVIPLPERAMLCEIVDVAGA